MYQFAPWKYWLVIIVMVLGTVFALPNMWDAVAPALQLSRNDRKPVVEQDQQRVLGLLKAQNIPIEAGAAYLEDERLVLRFDTSAQQTSAREAIIKGAPDEYLVAVATASRMPGWMRSIGLKPMSLGLDLRGGVQLVYEVDVDGAITQALDRLDRDSRQQLRSKRIPYLNSTISNGEIRITLRSAEDLSKAMETLKSVDGSLVLTSSESSAGPVLQMRMTPAEIKRRQIQAVEQNITTLRKRVDELGVSEPVITQQAVTRIVAQLPGVQDPNEAIRVLGATATVEFRLVDMNNDPVAAQTRPVLGSKLYQRREGGLILLKRDVIATGEQLTDASAGFSEGVPEVNVTLDSRGGDEMLRVTKENVGRQMGVVYIEKKILAEGESCKGTRQGDTCTQEQVINAATIQSPLSSRFRITGLEPVEARELALLLRSGALAAPQSIVEQRSVGPSLGKDNIERGVRAMVIGLVLTFIFMAWYYRAFGWVANAVLAANLIITVGVLSLMQASLSLPGIAAVVFHLGIAVDANILIYERIREELRAGNSPLSAINEGFEKAFATIADSNVTTLIAGIVLFAFGTGTIRSFAIVMTIGIGTSLFTSVVGSRALVHAVWGRRRRLERISI
jgi:preprotein translocase subunit SecD